jgi:coatomer subunit beta'
MIFLTAARCIKFIARKEWFLFGSHDGSIHVYKYKNKMKKVTSFKHHMGSVVTSLAVHPTHPYVLVACQSHIQLWDWDQSWFSWKCIQTFEGHSEDVYEVAFNPEDTNSFASVSADRTIKVFLSLLVLS